MQIHDELLLEVDEELVQDVAWWLKGVMEGVVSLSVPMIAEFKSGTRWGELSKLELAK
jgi:DNA polymerase-1